MSDGNPFRRLWALGFVRLVPIIPPDAPISERSSLFKRVGTNQDGRGKTPGIQWGDGTWSGFDWIPCESTEADLQRWHDMGAGVGVKTGNGLVFVDSDTPKIEDARIVKEEAERFFGHLFPRIGRPHKWGFPLRTDADFRYCRIECGERDAKGRLQDRVEILSDGRQFVAQGIHPGTGKPYRWPSGMPALSDVPFVPAETIHAFLAACAARLPAASAIVQEGAPTDVEQSTLKADLELIRKAVAATPNTSALFPTREAYRDYGYAIKAATIDTPADGLEIYQDWCARWVEGENAPDIVEADWSRMKPPFRRGATWIFELATANSDMDFSGAAVASKWFVETPAEPEGLFPVESKSAATKLFQFTPLMDAANAALSASTSPLIKGLLDQGAMTVLYGESNTGKTFLAMDISFHIAAGLAWGGMKTTRFPVLYIAAEGGLGARKRAAALASRYSAEAATAAFHYLLHPVNLLRADADLGRLVASVKAVGVQFGLIVVDTLSRAMAGGDENSSTDMGAMVKHLDALRAATSAHIMVVHHSGKDRAKGARGHSLLRAATDTEIEVSEREIAVTKQRDLDKSFASGFELDVMTLGVDADGEPVTSCVVRLVKSDPVAVGAGATVSQKEADVLKAVSVLSALSEDQEAGVSVAELVDYFGNRVDDMSANAVRALLKRMTARGVMDKSAKGRWKALVVTSGQASGQNVFE